MPVETPLEALATPELDGKRLVSFCKAMELTTLTRRVAEICGVDMGVDRAGPALRRPRGVAGRPGRGAVWSEKATRPRKARARPPLRAGPAPAPAPRTPKAAPPDATPADLAAARAKQARAPIDRDGLQDRAERGRA